jgi:hypothetical protein
VPVQIAGHNLWFVLDSGSGRMLIDKSRAAALGLRMEGTDSLQGAGKGRVPIQFVHDVLIRLQGLESRYTTFSAVDLKSASEALGRSVDGILGFEFLSQFVVTVDYEKKTLRIEVPEAFSQPLQAHAIPIEFHGQWPTVKAEMKIAEDITIQETFLVDSGSGDAVDHPVAKTMESKQEITSGVGLGTPVTGYLGKLSGFKLGAFLFVMSRSAAVVEPNRPAIDRRRDLAPVHPYVRLPPQTHILRAEPVLPFPFLSCRQSHKTARLCLLHLHLSSRRQPPTPRRAKLFLQLSADELSIPGGLQPSRRGR